jgi:hypothetical protein
MPKDASKPRVRPGTDFPHGIGGPATDALRLAGYTRLKQLAKVSEADLLKLHGVGPKAISVLRAALAERGLAFAAAKGKRAK